jgi:glyoxylase I family protein
VTARARRPRRTRGKALELIGIDHIYLAVSDLARSEAFYDRVMRALGFKKGTAAIGNEPHCHYYNRSFAISIRPARRVSPHDPYAPGLHHLCMRAPDEAAVDAAARALRRLGLAIDGPRRRPEYAPDYYAVFFEDPDGIQLEVMNHIARRRLMHRRFDDLIGFVNPLDRLLARERKRRG